jgi:nucleoside-diphosphate-sugar epimerase
MTKKLNILLTGATGTVGYEVLKQLYKQKSRFNITAFDVRNTHSVKKFRPFKNHVEIIYGDISNSDKLKQVCYNKDVVIHLAAVIPPVADDYPKLAEKVNFYGTRNLVDNLAEQSPDVFFLYSSSIAVYGDRLNNPYIKVGDPLIPAKGDKYANTKIKAEEYIKNSPLDWSIFRLTAIMGNHKMSKLMFHQPLNTLMEIATPTDTARAFVKAIDYRNRLSKKIFNLSGGKACRIQYKEFLNHSFYIYGLGKLDFPAKTFAERNFHCGYYTDSDILEEILHFRKDTIKDYFDKEKQKISKFKKMVTSVFNKVIKKHLLKLSEPYKAFIHNDIQTMKHFF